jgi:hypothetical protein
MEVHRLLSQHRQKSNGHETRKPHGCHRAAFPTGCGGANVETLREDSQTVNTCLPDCECFVCGAEIRSHETYCAACIAADTRRCFSCRQEYRCNRDYIECASCSPRPPRGLTLAEDICLYIDAESPPSARSWLRRAARWQAELPGTLRQLELGLLAAAHRLVGRRIKGLCGETRGIVLDCLGRIVHEEAVAAWAAEKEIDRLAATDAVS